MPRKTKKKSAMTTRANKRVRSAARSIRKATSSATKRARRKTKRAAMTTRVNKRVRSAARSIRKATSSATKRARRAVMPSRRGRAPLARSAREDALALLRADHKEVRRLLEELKSAPSGERRERVFHQVEDALKTHTKIEEEIFYPAVRELSEKAEEMIAEAFEEHHVVDLVLAELPELDPEDERFEAKMTVLQELIEHHVKEEEKEMFQHAQKLGKEELDALGERMAAEAGEAEEEDEAA
jgi:Hemerythrin HHE cation binding domain